MADDSFPRSDHITTNYGVELPRHHYWECKVILILWKIVWWFVTKMKTFILQPTNPTHRHFPKRNENIYLHQDL